jgi:hypothetical protein
MNDEEYRLEDDGRDDSCLWERCRGIIERGIKRYGDAGSLPISGTGRARKKKDQSEVKPKKKIARKKK